MAAWNMLFFTEGAYRKDPDKFAEWSRGAYLVEGLMHCGACHTERDIAGSSKKSKALQGGETENWYAPILAVSLRSGLGGWSAEEIVEYLATGSNAKTSAAGPMAEVIAESSQYLSHDDLQAIAVYLKNMPEPQEAERAEIDLAELSIGAGLYADNCIGCHMQNGEGQKNAFPPLKDSSAVQAKEPLTVIQVIVAGAAMPATNAKPTGLAMPEFRSKHQ